MTFSGRFARGRMRALPLGGALAFLCSAVALAAPGPAPRDLEHLSLEQLTSMPVSAAAPREQSPSHAAAAVFVLTQDDIRRAGATSVPQALRLVPGLQVAQLDGARWTVSVRGFNRRMSNRVLVMIDGRSLYAPIHGGVLWEMQDTMIEEIERIEIVRGPGGAMWGANAFAGVINIITKHAGQTGGGLVNAEMSAAGAATLAMRWGDPAGDVKWRVFGKATQTAPNADKQGGPAHDDAEQLRIGGRVDIDIDEWSSLRLNAEAYEGWTNGGLYDINAVAPAFSDPPQPTGHTQMRELIEGGFISGRYRRSLPGGAELRIDGSAQSYSLENPFVASHGANGALDLQHTLAPFGRHRLVWGARVRGARDRVHEDNAWAFAKPEINTWTYSAFVQDDIAFWAEQFVVTAAANAEYMDFEGWRVLPSLRARIEPHPNTTLWAAVSTGRRAPASAERFGRMGALPGLAPYTAGNPTPAPLFVRFWGDEDMESEEALSFEVGWRQRLGERMSADLALFRTRYSGVMGFGAMLTPVCMPGEIPLGSNLACVATAERIVAPVLITNVYDEDVIGGELTLTYRPLPNWRLIGAYTRLDHRHDSGVLMLGDYPMDERWFLGGFDPRSQASLRSSLSLNRTWELDAQLRYVDRLEAAYTPAYTELNARLAWRPSLGFEAALAGANLLHDRHQEFMSDLFEFRPVLIERTVFLQGRWFF